MNQETKRQYEQPKADLILFDLRDFITTSGGVTPGGDPFPGEEDELGDE